MISARAYTHDRSAFPGISSATRAWKRAQTPVLCWYYTTPTYALRACPWVTSYVLAVYSCCGLKPTAPALLATITSCLSASFCFFLHLLNGVWCWNMICGKQSGVEHIDLSSPALSFSLSLWPFIPFSLSAAIIPTLSTLSFSPSLSSVRS